MTARSESGRKDSSLRGPCGASVSPTIAGDVILRGSGQAVTVKGRGRVGVSVSRAGEHIQVVVTGKIGLGRPGMVIRRAPPGDTLYTVSTCLLPHPIAY